MSGWLRGAHHDVALAFGDDVVTYGRLARAVAEVRLPGGDGPIGCPVGMAPAALITTVLAALEHERSVLIGSTTAEAERVADRLPAGTELVLRTSGSADAAGEARVVARTNDSWLASAAPLAELTGLTAADRVAITAPLHVSMQLYAALHALWLGASVGDRLEGATAVHVTPTRLSRVLERAAPPATAVVAGAAMTLGLAARAAARGIRLVEYYGAAELSFVAVGEQGELAPFPGVEVALRPGRHGAELWARSPYLALGVVGGGMLRRDADGFATVGDLAERTAGGGLRVLGRGDAAITTAGATVLAEDVEARLGSLPGVDAAAVVGEPHELLGERIVAVVELSAGADLDQVVTAARARLDPAELPRRWLVAPVPRTDAGKVARGRIRDAIERGVYGPGSPSLVDTEVAS